MSGAELDAGKLRDALLRAGQRVCRLLSGQPLALLAFCLLLMGSVSLSYSVRTPFWYDEMYTFRLCRLPDFGSIWAALSQGVDLQPPALFILTRASWALFGHSEAATRLPALLGFALLCACLFWFVSRRTTPLWGAVACLMPMTTGAFAFSYEARPYGLTMGFTSLALLSWQLAAEGKWRRAALAGLWLGLALAVSSHYYAVLAFLPIAAGETVRSIQRRRIDWPASAAILLASPVVFLYLPLVRAGVALQGANPWNPPSLTILYQPYMLLFSAAAVPLAWLFVTLLFVLKARTAPEPGGPGLSLPETAACLTFLILPLPALVIARLGANMIHPRYLLFCIVGFSALAAMALCAASGQRSLAALASAIVLGGWFAGWNGTVLKDLPPLEGRRWSPSLPAGNGLEQLPVIYANADHFMRCLHYCEPGFRSRVYLVADPERAFNRVQVDAVDKNLLAAARHFRLPLLTYEQLRRQYPRFILIWNKGPYVWLPMEIQAGGARMSLVSAPGDSTILLVDWSAPPISGQPAR